LTVSLSGGVDIEKVGEDKKITVVSNSISAQKLKDDLFRFIEVEPHSLDSSTLLINQNTHQLTFSAYKDLNEFQTNHIILMDLCFTSINEIEYALNLSDISVHILYEEDCQEIKQLRSKYE
jgi:site-specific recombinase